jgi:hypothetical protein
MVPVSVCYGGGGVGRKIITIHTAEIAEPIIRWLSLAVPPVFGWPPDIPLPVFVIFCFATPRLLKPLVLITRMVDHQVHDILQTPCMQLADQIIMVLHGSVPLVDIPIIRDVISHVDLWGGEDWR